MTSTLHLKDKDYENSSTNKLKIDPVHTSHIQKHTLERLIVNG